MEDKKENINDDTCKLYIGGVIPTWGSDQIKEILQKESGCDVMRVDSVKTFAFAFVATKDIGEKIIEKVHGKVIEDSRIVIQISKNKQNLPDSDDLCFECGKPGHWAKECAQRRARMASRRTYNRPPYGRGGPPSTRERDPYYDDRRYPPPPVTRERDPYGRYDPYTRDYYPRDPYYRDAYTRDPYAYTTVSRYTYEYGRYSAADPYAPRSIGSRDSLYAAERERVAYGPSAYAPVSAQRSYEPAPTSSLVKGEATDRDPYAVVSRRPVNPYEPVRRVDLYASTTASRSAYSGTSYLSSYSADLLARPDPYERTSDRYASDPAPKRFPEPAYAPRAK